MTLTLEMKVSVVGYCNHLSQGQMKIGLLIRLVITIVVRKQEKIGLV